MARDAVSSESPVDYTVTGDVRSKQFSFNSAKSSFFRLIRPKVSGTKVSESSEYEYADYDNYKDDLTRLSIFL